MRIIHIIVTTLLILATFAAGCIVFIAEHPWVDFSALAHYQPGKPSIVLDEDGNEWARFQLDKREPIKLAHVPHTVIQAFLAAEDRAFYQHAGISWRGIARSFVINMIRGRRAQGASTITQQLVKLLFFDTQKTFTRKLKEQLLACIVEQQFTKDQILEIYLNHIYFGCGIYGIKAAAQRFWKKEVEQLTTDEAAILAGIIRSPAKYCPLEHPENALQRRNVVLRCMHEAGYLDAETYESLHAKPLQLAPRDSNESAPHAKEMVRQLLEELVGKHTLYTGGLTIQTTLNKSLQETAAHVFVQHINKLRTQIPEVDGALICLDTANAGIKAIVGGYSYKTSQFNRALQAKRQMGSTFKPLVYAAALEHGAQLTDVKVDQPVSFTVNNVVWEPKNAQKRFDGPMTLAYALTPRSNNSIPVQIVLEIGTDTVIKYAQACKLSGPLYPYPSLALGCVDSTPQEVAGMFNCFANAGNYAQPYLIAWVKDQLGNKIWKHTPTTHAVMSSQISSQITKALTAGKRHWETIVEEPWPACEVAGKTGTTNDARTCWFVGSTPSYTTAIYIGRDDNKPMGNHVYAVRTTIPIWLGFNNQIKQPRTQFSYDPRLMEMVVHQKTGKRLWNTTDPDAITLLTS